jgi:photosystem II stability/assembly factor-like uncharacterized protein
VKKFLPYLFILCLAGIISSQLIVPSVTRPSVKKEGSPMNPGYYEQYYLMKKNEAGIIPRIDYREWINAGLNKTSDSTLIDSIFEMGPFNVGGRTRAILVDQLDVNHIFAGGVSGGLWESFNQGLTWKTVNDFAPNLGVTAITQDPFNPQIIYYGTGESANNIDALAGQGIFKSTDGGSTFTQLDSTLNDEFKYIWDVVASTTDSNTVYVSTRYSGLFVTRDAGLSFQKIFTTGNPIHDIEFFPDGSIMIGVAKQGIYRSPDGTAGSFTKLTTGLPGTGYSRIELAYCQTKPANVYVMFSNYSDNGMMGFYRSSDGGSTWEIRTNPATGGSALQVPFSWYCFTMGVHPVDSHRVICASTNIRRTSNGGSSWSRVDNSHSDYHAVITSTQLQNKILVGNDGGVHRYDWTDLDTSVSLNEGYNTSQFYAGAFMPYGNSVIGGTQDNGTNATFNDKQEFVKMYGADGAFTQINQQDPNIAFLSIQNGIIYNSLNYLAPTPKFDKITNELDANGDNVIDEGAWFINPFEINLLDGSQLYYLTKKKLWKSKDGGWSWQPATKQISGGGLRVPYAIGISSSTPTIVYLGGSDGLFYRLDSAVTATPGKEVNLSSSIPPSVNTSFIACIKVHPYDPGNLHVAFSNYSTQGRVWKVYGANSATPTWINVSGDLPENLPVNWVDTDPMDPDSTIIAATDFGLYVTHDGGQHWIKESNIPNVPIDMIKVRHSDRKLFIFTHGRGIWRAQLMPFGTNVSVKPAVSRNTTLKIYPNPHIGLPAY